MDVDLNDTIVEISAMDRILKERLLMKYAGAAKEDLIDMYDDELEDAIGEYVDEIKSNGHYDELMKCISKVQTDNSSSVNLLELEDYYDDQSDEGSMFPNGKEEE